MPNTFKLSNSFFARYCPVWPLDNLVLQLETCQRYINAGYALDKVQNMEVHVPIFHDVNDDAKEEGDIWRCPTVDTNVNLSSV